MSSLFSVVHEVSETVGNTYTQSQFNLSVGLGAGLGIFLALIVGIALGWYIALRMFKKQIKENPPVTEKQIRMMYNQMGRKPSEKQIKQIMNQFKKAT